jgi:hypothetical protein
MRQVFHCGTPALVLAAALLTPDTSRADSVPFLQVAQQHHAEQDGEKGVIFHVTGDFSALRGKPCTVVIHILDRDGQPIRAIREEYSSGAGTAAVRASFTPEEDDAGVTTEVFMPYGALAAGAGEQDLQIRSNVWDDTQGSYVATRAFRADMQFDAAPSQDEASAAQERFERDRDRIGREWHRHHRHHHRHHHHRHPRHHRHRPHHPHHPHHPHPKPKPKPHPHPHPKPKPHPHPHPKPGPKPPTPTPKPSPGPKPKPAPHKPVRPTLPPHRGGSVRPPHGGGFVRPPQARPTFRPPMRRPPTRRR